MNTYKTTFDDVTNAINNDDNDCVVKSLIALRALFDDLNDVELSCIVRDKSMRAQIINALSYALNDITESCDDDIINVCDVREIIDDHFALYENM